MTLTLVSMTCESFLVDSIPELALKVAAFILGSKQIRMHVRTKYTY